MRRPNRTNRWLAVGALGLLPGCAAWEQERAQSAALTKQNADIVWTKIEAPIQPASAAAPEEEPKKDIAPKRRQPFTLPSGLPGAEAAPILLPPLKDLPAAEREKRVRAAYPVVPPMPEAPVARMPETGQPYTLPELQQLALTRNPTIKRARADADAAYGTMIQVGLYPNPHAGYEGDQIQAGPLKKNNAGQQGAFIQQLIKTCGKLTLARAAAGMDYANAQVALRRAEFDVITQVRTGYYAVLVARETMNVSRTLTELIDEVYRLQLRLAATGDTAGYEPLQLYAQAAQARNIYIQASNRYVGAWRQLAANLGMPELELKALAGTADAALPRFDGETAQRRVVENHTDVLTALNTILQAQYQLRLAQVTPIPDIQLGTAIQHDNAVGNNQVNVLVGFAIPVFDRNQGGQVVGSSDKIGGEPKERPTSPGQIAATIYQGLGIPLDLELHGIPVVNRGVEPVKELFG